MKCLVCLPISCLSFPWATIRTENPHNTPAPLDCSTKHAICLGNIIFLSGAAGPKDLSSIATLTTEAEYSHRTLLELFLTGRRPLNWRHLRQTIPGMCHLLWKPPVRPRLCTSVKCTFGPARRLDSFTEASTDLVVNSPSYSCQKTGIYIGMIGDICTVNSIGYWHCLPGLIAICSVYIREAFLSSYLTY